MVDHVSEECQICQFNLVFLTTAFNDRFYQQQEKMVSEICDNELWNILRVFNCPIGALWSP